MFTFLVGLVPCCPVCHLLPTFVYGSFPSTSPVPLHSRIPLVGFPPTPLSLDTTHGGCAALPTQLSLSSCHLTMNCSAASRTPRYNSATCWLHKAVSTPNTKGGSSVDPSVARNPPRCSTMHLCQVLNCPPGLGFSPTSHRPDH